MIVAAWFDDVEESFSYREVQFNDFCLPVKTSCLRAENVTENQLKSGGGGGGGGT